MTRLVAVSNRIHVPTRGVAPGGLTAGVLAALRARPGLWFGWGGRTSRNAGFSVVRTDGVTYASMVYDRYEYEDFYLGFCNGTLWPLFHEFAEAVHYCDSQYEGYQRMNQRYARQLGPLLAPSDLIWVHDYHLLPLAARLRGAGYSQPIGLFLHIPFPQPDVLRMLPVYRELLQAMLAYDVVGFQTEPDRGAFCGAVASVWGPQALASDDSVVIGGRRCITGVFPIGVDVGAIRKEADGSPTETRMEGQKLIIGVDRLDYTKGLVQRVGAYERFLMTYPRNRKRVSFLQIAAPSRTDIPAYAGVRHDLEHALGETNARFAATDWTPIRYRNRAYDHDVLMGLMRSAHVGVVTPLRDGMNLVAKEFVAAQDPADPGVLILSSYAGAAHELTGALLVNPYDLRGIARAIQRALTMPLAERRERHQAMLDVLGRNSIEAWHTRFIDVLESVGHAAPARQRQAGEGALIPH